MNHLRIADDIVIITEGHQQLQYMLNTIDPSSRSCGLEMNPGKTCVMTNGERKRTLSQLEPLDFVDEYLYLRQNITFKGQYINEVERRIKKVWSNKDTFKSKTNISLKKNEMDSIVTSIVLYGCQTWPTTIINKMQVFRKRPVEKTYWAQKL